MIGKDCNPEELQEGAQEGGPGPGSRGGAGGGRGGPSGVAETVVAWLASPGEAREVLGG